MGKGPQKVAYVVFRGRTPGIYNTWSESFSRAGDGLANKFLGTKPNSRQIDSPTLNSEASRNLMVGGRQAEFRYKQWLKKEGETQYKQHSESLRNVSSGAAKWNSCRTTKIFQQYTRSGSNSRDTPSKRTLTTWKEEAAFAISSG